jgi:alpha-amylase/alpha-mannosidase (GH57 family)
MPRYVCIHCHFYQPPRENPWLEAIELQDSASPYHDWNERITAECYQPNTASRILDDEGRIHRIVNNYASMSFDFGPTLLRHLEPEAPEVYRAILDADVESRERFGGHGSALAQAYHHTILPLMNGRDKVTQVRWGVRDFETRFGRAPEGMWLPETAVDLETLEILVDHGIRFTVLAPRQAARVRERGGKQWTDVQGARIDPRRAYEQRLPSGRTISLLFYDGPASRAVAFERLLSSGEAFAHRILGLLQEGDAPQLAHLATDGETYGHHHRHGDMALAYALDAIRSNEAARVTNYGEFLERHPPQHEVEIIENTSWSCVHGVERWRADCGCNSGRAGWHQHWRKPLREALDWLRDQLETRFEAGGRDVLVDPWAARDAYVEVVLDRGSTDAFLRRHAAGTIDDPGKRVRALELLELQRHAMLMYTSCGWFFDEVSGIETVQVLQYACRALQLAQELTGEDLEPAFLSRLEAAPSNLPEIGNARVVYERFVRPAMVDLPKVGAHYALSAPFENYGEKTRINAYEVEKEDYRLEEAGRTRFGIGKARVTSTITGESALLSFAVVHAGDHNLNGGVRPFQDQDAYETMIAATADAFRHGDLPGVYRLLDHHFGRLTYSVRSLFRDGQRHVLRQILDSTIEGTEAVYRHLYETHTPLIRFLADIGVPQPRAFRAAAELVLSHAVRRELTSGDPPDPERIEALLDEARDQGMSLDGNILALPFGQALGREADAFLAEPDSLGHLERFTAMAGLALRVSFEVDLFKAQNVCYRVARDEAPRFARRQDAFARSWNARMADVEGILRVRVD